MNTFLMILYVLSAVIGSTLIKIGGAGVKPLFIVPIVNMGVSFTSLIGILAYGISFVAYVILLTKMDLSYISPLLIGFVYILLMLTAFIIFKEEVTFYKILGCTLILAGIVLVLLKK